MAMFIEESGMKFGPYGEEQLFYIEKSSGYSKMVGLKISEFIVLNETCSMLDIIEAKSSSPKPVNDVRFDDFIDEITEKMSNTLALWFAIKMGRHGEWINEMPKLHRDAPNTLDIKLVLVINGHKIEWLQPIKNQLCKKLKRYCKHWNIVHDKSIIVLNDELARKHKLISTG